MQPSSEHAFGKPKGRSILRTVHREISEANFRCRDLQFSMIRQQAIEVHQIGLVLPFDPSSRLQSPVVIAARSRSTAKEKCGSFSYRRAWHKMLQSVEDQLLSRIRGKGRGWVFSQHDFTGMGNRSAIDLALHRLLRKGTIRRVMRGIYNYPRFSTLLNQELSPDADQTAQSLARKFGWRIQPSGPAAQNLLGLSTQVPARIVYLSDGPDRSYLVGNTSLVFEHTALKEAGFKRPESGLIVQAIKSFGQDRITPEVIAKIRRWLDPKLREKILADTRTATGWIYAVIQQVCREVSHG